MEAGQLSERAPSRSVAEPMIVAQGLRRSFGANDAVAGIDLEVAAGQIYGFLGPNGAGKSTTVRMLCTSAPPSTSGSGRTPAG